MKQIITLVAGSLLLAQLTACGGQMMPAANMMPRQMGPTPTQVSSQSILGINKEIGRAVEANFKAKDANGDGFITPNEFPVESPEDFNHFRRFDSNKDGKLKVNEMKPGILSRAADIYQLKATAAFLFDELDVDNNKRLTKAEVDACKVPGVAGSYDAYLGKSLFGKKLDYLRKTDFENLMAFALLGPSNANRVTPAAPPAAR